MSAEVEATNDVNNETNNAADDKGAAGPHSVFIGQPPSFNHTGTEDFAFFQNRLSTFFTANDISSADKKKAIFLTCLGDKTFKLLNSLCAPETPDTFGFDELMDKLIMFYNPKTVLPYFKARVAFYNARKKESENYVEWAKRLEELSTECNFGIIKDNLIKDLFVIGLGFSPIKNRLLEEDPTSDDVTLEYLTQIAQMAEAVKAAFEDTTTEPPKKKAKCISCGMTNHPSSECRYKNMTCTACGLHGHISPGCKQKLRMKKQQNAARKFGNDTGRRNMNGRGAMYKRDFAPRSGPRDFYSGYQNRPY